MGVVEVAVVVVVGSPPCTSFSVSLGLAEVELEVAEAEVLA